MTDAEAAAVRKQWHILVEGEHIPPPITSFRAMKFPEAVVKHLQVCYLPCGALAARPGLCFALC